MAITFVKFQLVIVAKDYCYNQQKLDERFQFSLKILNICN